MKYKHILSAAVLTILSVGAASAATVVNGSFEDVDGLEADGLNRGTFGNYMSIPGWTAGAGTAGIELQNNATLGDRDAQDGNWYVELDSDSNSSMFQDVTFADAGSYLFSFFYAPRTADAADGNGIQWSIGGLTGFVDATTPSGWINVTQVFSAAADDIKRISFAAIGKSNSLGGFVDNVSISSLDVAPVPVPAAGLLLIGAFGAMGGIAARRRKQSAA